MDIGNRTEEEKEIDYMSELLIDEFGTEEHGWKNELMICVDVEQLAKFVNNYRRDAMSWEKHYFDLRRIYGHRDVAHDSANGLDLKPWMLGPFSIVRNGDKLGLYDPHREGDAFYKEFDDFASVVSWLRLWHTPQYSDSGPILRN